MWIHSPGQLCEAAKNSAEALKAAGIGAPMEKVAKADYSESVRRDYSHAPRPSELFPLSNSRYPPSSSQHEMSWPLCLTHSHLIASESSSNFKLIINNPPKLYKKGRKLKGFTCAFPRLAAPSLRLSRNSRLPSAANFKIQINPRTMISD